MLKWTCPLLLAAAAVASPALAAKHEAVDVKDGATTLKGDLYLPKGAKGPVPLVLVVHEWWGKTAYAQKRAQQIADQLGFAALAVDLYGDAKTASDPKAAGDLAGPFYKDPALAVSRLELFEAAAPAAAKKDKVEIDAQNVAAVGYCFGGTQALNLARGNKVKAAVGLHAGLASAMKAEPKVTTKVLVLNGGADPLVKPEETAAFQEEMKAAGADLKYIAYPGAKHAYTNPAATALGKKFNMPIAYDAKADKESWKEMATFLKANLTK